MNKIITTRFAATLNTLSIAALIGMVLFLIGCASVSDTLTIAVYKGDINSINKLISKGNDVNQGDDIGNTPLIYAAALGKIKAVNILLENGADPDVSSNNGTTPLLTASSNGHLEIVEILLKHDVNIDKQDDDGQTALYKASSSGHEKIVKLLIEQSVEINVKESKGRTPIFSAARSGYTEIVKLLVAHNADVNEPDNNGVYPVVISAFNGNKEILELLVNNGANIIFDSPEYGNVLHAAAVRNNEKISRYLIELGVYPVIMTNTAEDIFATALTHNFMADYLISKGDKKSALNYCEKSEKYYRQAKGSIVELISIYEDHLSKINTFIVIGKTLSFLEHLAWLDHGYIVTNNYSGTSASLNKKSVSRKIETYKKYISLSEEGINNCTNIRT